MKHYLVLLSLLLLIDHSHSKLQRMPSTRILNALNAEKHQFPYQVLVKVPGTICGGAILREKWIITTAVCLFNLEELIVYAGFHEFPIRDDGIVQKRKVEKIFNHQFNAGDDSSRRVNVDVALAQLVEGFTYNAYVQPVALPRDRNDCLTSGYATVAGWGSNTTWFTTNKKELGYATVPILPTQQCKDRLVMVDNTDFNDYLRKNGVICAGWDDRVHTMQYGDSGNPLVVKQNNSETNTTLYKLYGIAVHIFVYSSRHQPPSIFYSTCDEIDWINETMELAGMN